MKLHHGLLVSVWLCVLVGACIAQDGDKPADIEKPVEAVSHVEMEKPVEATNAEVTQPEEVEPRKGFTVKGLVSFANFKQRFHRVYNSFTEMLVRQKIFLMKAIQVVITHIKYKRRQLSYYYSVNQFSDRRPDELKSTLLPPEVKDERVIGGPIESNPKLVYVNKNGLVVTEDSVPTKPDMSNNQVFYDWRTSGCFNRPKNQMTCGSCYIFSAIGLLEYAHCAATGQLLNLSEQYVVDCGSRVFLKGCGGGRMESVMQFIETYGVVREEDYPYTATTDMCMYGLSGNEEKMGYFKAPKITYKKLDISDFEDAIKHGPFHMTIGADTSTNDYGGGVYEWSCKEDQFGHAVLIVGSGQQDGKDYWIIRNSWATSWGEEGYGRISKEKNCIWDINAFSLDTITDEETPFTIINSAYEKPSLVAPNALKDVPISLWG